MVDYAAKISGRLVVIGAYTSQRKEIRVPVLTHIKGGMPE